MYAHANQLKIGLVLMLISSHIVPATTSEKTFLRSRVPGTGLCMKPYIPDADTVQESGFSVQAVPFYQWSRNETDIGNYFGMKNSQSGDAIESFIRVQEGDPSALLNSNDIIHDHLDTATKMVDKVQLSPERQAWGTRIDVIANLGHTSELELQISAPIVKVQTSMRPQQTGSGAVKGVLPGTAGQSASLLDFLAGTVKNSSADNLQDPLELMKMTPDLVSRTGIGDIEWSLATTLLPDYVDNFKVMLLGTIPINKTTKGIHYFEPMISNGKHVGLGVGLQNEFIVSENTTSMITAFLEGRYQHFFKSNEIRSPLHVHANGNYLGWPLLVLGGESGKQGTFPMANALTQSYEVAPGDLFEGLAQLSMIGFGTELSIGYNISFRRKEKLKIIDWNDTAYGVAEYDYNTTAAFDANLPNHAFSAVDATNSVNAPAGSARLISADKLILESAATPKQILHTLTCSIHHKIDTESRFVLGLGGFFDIATKDNNALKEAAIWARISLSF